MVITSDTQKQLAALGIVRIEWLLNRSGEADWKVVFDDAEEMTVTVPILAGESAVVQCVSDTLAKRVIENQKVRRATC